MPDTRNWFTDIHPSRRRQLRPLQRHGVWVDNGTQRLLNFASNDYLGLSHHADVLNAAGQEIQSQGFGSGASRLVGGDCPAWHRLESELATWKGYEATLVLGSGMLANIGILDALTDRHTHLFCDRLNHASLVDGARLSRAKTHRYQHLDLTHLASLLQQYPTQRRIIVSDGVFSMDGDCADVAGLLALAEQHDALLLVDDAHGLGVLGSGGRGLTSEAGIQGHARLIEVGTFGKALGGYGACILGTNSLIEGLRQTLRTLIYSTALPACAATAASAALRVLQQQDVLHRLQNNIRLFAELSAEQGIIATRTAIQTVILGADDAALKAAASLQQQGFFVPAIRPPTVPEGTARLRITLSAAHEADHIKALVKALATLPKP